MEQNIRVGGYELESLHLITPHSSAKINVKNIYSSFELYENINMNFIYGNITLIDYAGIMESVPIIGEEIVEIEANKTPILGTEFDKIGGLFRVYNITRIEKTETGKQGFTYTLQFISLEYFNNLKTNVAKTYKDSLLSDVAIDVYDNYITKNISDDRKKTFNVEQTFINRDFVAANMHPYRVMELLTERSISNSINVGGAAYLFYETLSDFNFRSLETMLQEDAIDTLTYQPLASSDENAQTSYFNKISKYEIKQNFDILTNAVEGMYSSRLISYDMERMYFEQYNYNYIEPQELQTIQTVSSSGAIIETVIENQLPSEDKQIVDVGRKITPNGKLCSQYHDVLNNPDVKLMFKTTNLNHNEVFRRNLKQAGGYKEPGIKPTSVEQWSLSRTSQLQQMKNIMLGVTLADSNPNLHVGQMIEFKIPSEIPANQSNVVAPDEHFYYSGKYLITEINHRYSKSQGHIMTLTLNKNTLEQTLPNFDPELLEEETSTTLQEQAQQQIELGVQQ